MQKVGFGSKVGSLAARREPAGRKRVSRFQGFKVSKLLRPIRPKNRASPHCRNLEACNFESCTTILFIFMKAKPHIAVIGAGAFGGWTALHLLERGARVMLVDAWGPGNSRASSGGETRVMRGTYGPDQPYTEMAAQALKFWVKYERRWKRQFLHRTGVLWMASGRDDAFERGSVKMLRAAKIKYQELTAPQMKKRWPQINFEGVEWGIFEPECGYLEARDSCQAVVEAFVAAGGRYWQAAVLGDGLDEGPLKKGLELSDGSRLKADSYVFACGPWLGKRLEIGSSPPSRTSFSSGRLLEIGASLTPKCPYGRIIADDSATESLGVTDEDSRSRTIRADPLSIPLMESASLVRKR
jgi:glycine/D-amino acid oxidase-like deaminating enzyme